MKPALVTTGRTVFEIDILFKIILHIKANILYIF